MFCKTCFAVVGIAVITASIAVAQSSKDTTKQPPKAAPGYAGKDASPPDMPMLPPGWTEADMQACMEAGMPGPNHEYLAKSIGVWTGKTTMWMAPNTESMNSECTSTITPMMDGRFVKCETTGDMPGMGPFKGMGIYGYDNVSKTFQATWIDNCSTTMMTGTGDLASDGTTMTWNFHYTCPITKKLTSWREVHRETGKNTQTLEMYTIDPKSGKEFKMMEVVLTRKPGTTATAIGSEH